MHLIARLEELSEEGKRDDAITLAKATLRSTREVEVVVEESTVHVETEHFRGIHRWHLDTRDRIVIDEGGEYDCTSDEVELSFSTATMGDRALEKARSRITTRMERTTGTEPAGGETEPPGDDRTSRSGDRTAPLGGLTPVVDRVVGWITTPESGSR